MLTDELLSYLFAGQPHLLAQPMAAWLASSRRFAAFVTAFRDKIRKKLRATPDPESLLDLRLELETAYLLLQERALSLVYEPQPPRRVRSPDFAVTFTTRLTFMLEVKRLRTDQKSAPTETPEQTPAALALNTPLTTSLITERLADPVCDKLGQALPQHSNVLLLGVEALRLTRSELGAALLHLQWRVEGNDAALLQRHQFRDRADFFRHYQRLSALLVREIPLRAGEPAIVWLNPQAKHPLPAKVLTVLSRTHTL